MPYKDNPYLTERARREHIERKERDLYDNQMFNPWELEDRERNEHASRQWIGSMMYKLRGRTVTYREATEIIYEMVHHMAPEHAHRLICELYERIFPEIQNQCAERQKRWEHEAMVSKPIYVKQNGKIRMLKGKEIPHYFGDKEIELPKEDFLSKDEVTIK